MAMTRSLMTAKSPGALRSLADKLPRQPRGKRVTDPIAQRSVGPVRVGMTRVAEPTKKPRQTAKPLKDPA